jgi:hypothetical protein
MQFPKPNVSEAVHASCLVAPALVDFDVDEGPVRRWIMLPDNFEASRSSPTAILASITQPEALFSLGAWPDRERHGMGIP